MTNWTKRREQGHDGQHVSVGRSSAAPARRGFLRRARQLPQHAGRAWHADTWSLLLQALQGGTCNCTLLWLPSCLLKAASMACSVGAQAKDPRGSGGLREADLLGGARIRTQAYGRGPVATGLLRASLHWPGGPATSACATTARGPGRTMASSAPRPYSSAVAGDAGGCWPRPSLAGSKASQDYGEEYAPEAGYGSVGSLSYGGRACDAGQDT